MSLKRSLYVVWLMLIASFAALHLMHLQADFPNYSPWQGDWAKYTDEGWYANAAIHEHLLGHWEVPGDFAPAPGTPIWPFMEWVLFGFTGVNIEWARALVVTIFFANLGLTYVLLRKQGPLWMTLLTLSFLVTSPYLYCFSRLSTLEPLLTGLTLASIILAVRLPRMRHPVLGSVGLGLLSTMLMLTKPTAIFVFPAILCACLQSLWTQRKLAIRCAVVAVSTFAIVFGAWMIFLIEHGNFPQYRYLIEMNRYPETVSWWVFGSFVMTCFAGLKIDHILIPLGIVLTLWALLEWRCAWACKLWRNSAYKSSALVVLGYFSFVVYQSQPSPRYYAVLTFFLILITIHGITGLLQQSGQSRIVGRGLLGLIVVAITINGLQTINYAFHPQYSFVNAAKDLTRYVDNHPNGNRMLVSASGDSISLITHLPALCEPHGTEEFGAKLASYQPGWFAAWNGIPAIELAAIHRNFTLEQVAKYHAFDNDNRNLLVLFKLHPLNADQRKAFANLQGALPYPDDRIEIPILAR
jgi:hypothetical protein